MTSNCARANVAGDRAARSVAGVLLALTLVVQAARDPAAAAERPLAKRHFTVVAVVDAGINPYHLDFRRPELTAHPSTYIEGFPRTTTALRLDLEGAARRSGRGAYRRDSAAWDGVEFGKLYWIPGTSIVGAINLMPTRRNGDFYDSNGHGTAVASLAGGSIHGPPSDDILLVAVRNLAHGLRWAATQPWIDVITNSWQDTPRTAGELQRSARLSRRAVRSGKVVCFSSGNNAAPMLMLSSQGPSWNVNVGAASGTTGGEHVYTNYPNDVLGLAGVTAATAHSIDGEARFVGTSASAPNVCGRIATVLAETRAFLGDVIQGPHAGGLAAGQPGRGYLDDGVLDRLELEDAVQSTAVPAETSLPDPQDPYAIPALPAAHFVRGGYGIVDNRSMRQAVRVILGDTPRPERTAEDAWIAFTDALRDALWN
jgi:subtilisin family serine protease